MTSKYNVAVVGATSAVGEVIVDFLQERKFPVDKLYLLADSDQAGGRLEFNGNYLVVKNVAEFDFSQVQIALFAAGEVVAEEFAAKAAACGCIVIDSSRQFRLQRDIPLVVAGVNDDDLAEFSQRNIIASPASAVTQMMIALKPIYDLGGIDRVNVCTYQAVSEKGRAGVESLASQTASLLNMKEIKPGPFSKQIAFNVIPQVGGIDQHGYSEEEYGLVKESQKILRQDDLAITPTAVWVPVFFAHGIALHIVTNEKVSVSQVRGIFEQSDDIELVDDSENSEFPTPVSDGAGSDMVYIGRIREDISSAKGLNLWVVSDNVRRCAALNSVQLAEILIKNYLSQ